MKKKSLLTWVFPIALAFMLFSSACQLPVDPAPGTYTGFSGSFSPDMKVESKTFSSAAEIKSFFASGSGLDDYALSTMAPMARAESSVADGAGTKTDYSGTNVQVEGIDEADIIKTDGHYIYTITENTLFIIEAYPGEDARVLSRIGFNNSPQGLFINGDTLAVFGTSYNTGGGMLRYWGYHGNTFLDVFDITSKDNPQKTRSFELEGFYTEGRMIDNYAYLIVRSYADVSLPMPTPFVRLDGAESRIAPERVHFFGLPYNNPQYATIHMLNMDNGALDSESIVVEGGETVYMSHNNLYLATTQYINEWEIQQNIVIDTITPLLTADERALMNDIDNIDSRILSAWEKQHKKQEVISMHIYNLPAHEQDALQKDVDAKVKEALKKYEFRTYTIIHKVSVTGNSIQVKNTATLPGSLNNQFAMDEHNNVLRVATTTTLLTQSAAAREVAIAPDMPWERPINTENHVFTLDESMAIMDHERGIAHGERIFSTRFMGDRLYMVTFRDVDPFFTIDLSNPNDIRVLGELKIPGFSRYLHPYDENTIIGLGRDGTDEGRILGLKISLFDVSNPSNPTEKATYALEGQYSSSVAEWEHKAFLFSKEKGLLVIPAYSHDYRTGGERFNGALVFQVTESEITLRGLIDHSRANMWSGVERSLYIEELLYTKSPYLLRVNDISSLESVRDITLTPISKTDIPVY
jgi:inhibitor of cysteine peptidase